MPLTFDALIAERRAGPGAARPVMTPEGGTPLSLDAFDALVGRAAAWLRAQGIERHDRVAVWLPNHPHWLALLFGAARIGATVAAVNTRYRTAELHHILSSSGAKLLIFESGDRHADFHAMTAALDLATLPDLKALAAIDSADLPPIQGIPVTHCDFDGFDPLPPQDAQPSDPVILFTTSGTTSKPKLVMHTQETLSLHARYCAPAYGFDAPDAAYLAAMPLCGVFGLNPTLGAFAGGAPIHLLTAYALAPAIGIAKAQAITHFFGSDEMFRQMWDADRTVFSHARICGFGAFTPGMGATLRGMAEEGLPLCGVYGASELHAIFAIQPPTHPIDQRLQGGGRTAGGDTVSVRVRDPETGELCAPDQPGVLEVKGPTNFTGYFRNPEATAKAVDPEGYFRSGDAGYLRPDGTFVYLARNGDFLRLSGFLTDPAEIEEVLESADGVARAQVVGVTHEGRARAFAFILPKPGASPDPETVRTHTADRLAHYKVPLRVVPIESFPATESANGLKIQKAKLRDMAEAHLKDHP
ncbi:acyl-CoA synthetase [Primorskyibacter flagellatus]|uniref:Acyl-CoA synthetase n=1 Tax=Primorskyibacter flagellatus TaxID=1387277 RepID=A0A917ADJ9_9RHOB|nr:AMP-binding protein [Primorskyibacter flagellatus]GGE44971.1 acyl-CoA synthetase [Primorskyibacter flagellatus]